jgi:hypothetical protein
MEDNKMMDALLETLVSVFEKKPRCRDCDHYLKGKDAALCLFDGCIADGGQNACVDYKVIKIR